MDFTYDDLRKKTVAELREIAKEIDHEAVKGYTQLKKERLILALCAALDIEACKKKKSGASCTVKAQIKEAKDERDAAIEARDLNRLKQVRRKLHRLKRMSRRPAAGA